MKLYVISCVILMVCSIFVPSFKKAFGAENGQGIGQSGANQILLQGTNKNRSQWPKQYDTAIFEAIDKHASNLKDKNNSDLRSWCPLLDTSDPNAKKLLYSEVLYKLTQYESGYRPGAAFTEGFSNSSGESVVSTGMLQISYESANIYKCSRVNGGKSISTSSLKDPIVNLQCGVLIMDKLIGQNNKIAGSGCNGWCGASRYWSPLRKSDKTEQIKNYVKSSPVCTGKAKAVLAQAKSSSIVVASKPKPVDESQLPEELSGVLKNPTDISGLDEKVSDIEEIEFTGLSLN